jgi:A/G-specific adenine glycosylase
LPLFSYNEVVPVVDGNVFRVLSRYFDVETDIALASAKKKIHSSSRVDAKNDPATTAIMGLVLYNVFLNPSTVLFVLAVLRCKKKVDQLPVKSKS